MSAIVSQFEEIERNQGELETVSTTLVNRQGRRFPGHPIAVVSPVHSLAQTSANYLVTGIKKYYLPTHLQSLVSKLLPSSPYQLKTIEEQPEKLETGDIAIYALTRSISRQNVGFTQASMGVRRGKFLHSSVDSLSTSLPRSQPKLQNCETDEDGVLWRGVFTLPRSSKVLFSKEVEIKANELSTWKPRVVIDSYRLEDDEQ